MIQHVISNLKFGLTVGVWDLFHAGHANHLRVGVENCDILLVGVTTDYITAMQKGPQRPGQTYTTRADSVARFLDSLPARYVVFSLDTLTLPASLAGVVSITFAGPDQLDRFYSHPANNLSPLAIIDRTEGVSTTLLLRDRYS